VKVRRKPEDTEMRGKTCKPMEDAVAGQEGTWEIPLGWTDGCGHITWSLEEGARLVALDPSCVRIRC
jgi:hypothetical protein